MERKNLPSRELKLKPENLSLADNFLLFASAEKKEEQTLKPDTLIALTSLYTNKGKTPNGQSVAQLVKTIVQKHGGVAPEQEIPGQYLKAALMLTVGRIEKGSFTGTAHEVKLLQAVASRMSQAADLMEDYPDAADLLSSLEQAAQNLGVKGGISGLLEYIETLSQEHEAHQDELKQRYEEGRQNGIEEQQEIDAKLIEDSQEEIEGLKEQIESERIARQQAEQKVQQAEQRAREAEQRTQEVEIRAQATEKEAKVAGQETQEVKNRAVTIEVGNTRVLTEQPEPPPKPYPVKNQGQAAAGFMAREFLPQEYQTLTISGKKYDVLGAINISSSSALSTREGGSITNGELEKDKALELIEKVLKEPRTRVVFLALERESQKPVAILIEKNKDILGNIKMIKSLMATQEGRYFFETNGLSIDDLLNLTISNVVGYAFALQQDIEDCPALYDFGAVKVDSSPPRFTSYMEEAERDFTTEEKTQGFYLIMEAFGYYDGLIRQEDPSLAAEIEQRFNKIGLSLIKGKVEIFLNPETGEFRGIDLRAFYPITEEAIKSLIDFISRFYGIPSSYFSREKEYLAYFGKKQQQ